MLEAIRVYPASDGPYRVLKAQAHGIDAAGEHRIFGGAVVVFDDTVEPHARLVETMLRGMAKYSDECGGITWTVRDAS